jgi:hypothetical protein
MRYETQAFENSIRHNSSLTFLALHLEEVSIYIRFKNPK